MSLADALREHGASSPAVRRAAQAMTAARRPAALAAARLAAYAATPQNPLSQALSGLRFHVLLACSSSLRNIRLLPWEVMLLRPLYKTQPHGAATCRLRCMLRFTFPSCMSLRSWRHSALTHQSS